MKTIVYNIEIITKTGLHIGSGNAKIEIGGMDQPIIKDMSGLPYIPASSLKGKLRSLYEIYKYDKELLNEEGNSLKTFDGINYDEVSMFFGKAGNIKCNINKLGPTRFIFRDLKLTEESKEKLLSKKNKGEKYLDEKIECSIDRKDGIVKDASLRPLERVPTGIEFEGKLIIRLFEKPDKETEENNLKEFGENLEILKNLLENDYLGGQGTRGSGEVKITFKKI